MYLTIRYFTYIHVIKLFYHVITYHQSETTEMQWIDGKTASKYIYIKHIMFSYLQMYNENHNTNAVSVFSNFIAAVYIHISTGIKPDRKVIRQVISYVLWGFFFSAFICYSTRSLKIIR